MTSAISNFKPESAFTIQCRVVYALILRDVKARFGRRQLGFLWALLEPLMFISLFIGIFHLIGKSSQSGIPIPLFFVTGFVPFFMFRDLYPQVAGSAKGIIPLLMFPQVSRTDVMIASVILTSLLSITVMSLMLLTCHAVGYEFQFERPLQVMVAVGLMILLGTGTGLVVGALTIRYEFVSSIAGMLLGRPLFITSGLFFTAESVPANVREYLLFNPLLHCIESIRSGMFTSFESRYADLGYVLMMALVLNALGLILLGYYDRQRI